MKINNQFSSVLFAALLGATISTSSCKKDDDTPPAPTPTPTVVGVAQADTTFSILVAAVVKANLATTLSDPTKLYTVFAPTNNAFRAAGITAATIQGYTQGQVDTVLVPILTYHVLGAKVLAAGVPASDTVKTLNGKNIFASKNANGVFVNGIKVTGADVPASNGVVHVIGSVLIPPTKTIAQIVIGDPANFSLLLAAVSRAGLAGALSGAGKYTVFAPTNAAFAATPYNTAPIITAADATVVGGIVKAHVIGTNVFAGDLIAAATANTLNTSPQQTLTISLPAAVKITGSANAATAVVKADIVATNGVIHVIGSVLL
jgi:uncharacterized surface protein with fasciclin (FAS1) repeats